MDSTQDNRKVFVRTPYNYDRNEASRQSGLRCTDPTRTIQAEKDNTDINVMMERFGQAAKIPQGHQIPRYGDFTGVSDYHTAVNEIAAAGERFDALPAVIRDRFHNDPGEYVNFCLDEANKPELEKLGLIQAKRPEDAYTRLHPETVAAMAAALQNPVENQQVSASTPKTP